MFTCPRCLYSTDKKSNLKKHLLKPSPCTFLHSNKDRQDIIDELDKKKPKNTCMNCNKKFAFASGLSKHKKICRMKDVQPDNTSVVSIASLASLASHLSLESPAFLPSLVSINSPVSSESPESHTSVQSLSHESTQSHQYMTKKLLKLGECYKIQNLLLELQYYKNRKKEVFYQMLLEKVYNSTHKTLPHGITDISTDNAHMEIKCWDKWKDVIGQLFSYNDQDPKEELHVYLFGRYKQHLKYNAYDTISRRGIKVFEFEEDEEGFIKIVNFQTHEVIYAYHPLHNNSNDNDD